MQLIDRYLARRFLKFFLLALIAALSIYLVVDPIENLDDFLDKGVPKQEILRYYILYIPYIIYLTFPVAVLLATMFCIGGLTSSNELMAMTASGVPLYRHLLWLSIIGLIMSLFVLWFGETIVPMANRERLSIWREKVKRHSNWRMTEQGQIYLQESEGRVLHLDRYNPKTKSGYGVDLFRFEKSRIAERTTADQMLWNGHEWYFLDVIERRFTQGKDQVKCYTKLDVKLSILPDDMVELKIEPEEMGMTELRKFVERIRQIGGVTTQWMVDIHSKVALPMAGVIIILFGVPISAVRRRSGLILGITISLLIAFIYFGLMQTGKVLGYKEILNPWLAAWLGNIVFFVLGVVMLNRVPK